MSSWFNILMKIFLLFLGMIGAAQAQTQPVCCKSTIFDSTPFCSSLTYSPCNLITEEGKCLLKVDVINDLGLKDGDCKERTIACTWSCKRDAGMGFSSASASSVSSAKPKELKPCPTPQCPSSLPHTFDGLGAGSRDPWCCTEPMPNPNGDFCCKKRSKVTNPPSGCKTR